MNKTAITYRDKKVYVGIDVHKKTYSITASCDGEIVKRDTMRADINGLIGYLRKRFKGAIIYSAYEAGFSGFGLHRGLVKSGISNIVVNAGSIEIAANDKVKTDRRDSRKIAEQLSRGVLQGIYIPTEKEELDRILTRSRKQIARQKSRVANQIKSKLHYFGLIEADDEREITNKYLLELEARDLAPEIKYSLKLFIEQWRFYVVQLAEIRKKIDQQAKENKDLEEVYRSVPGVGSISARTLANELGDLSKRFSNEKRLFSYTGLTPSEHSSGEKVHKGHISRQGASWLRDILIEVAWRAIKKDGALLVAFERIGRVRGKKRAIVAIARKLIGRIRACFREGVTYQLGVCG